MSEISKGTFRSRFNRTKDAEASAEKETSPKVEKVEEPTAEEIIQEITYESEKSDDEEVDALKTIDKNNLAVLDTKPKVEKEGADEDAATVATSAVDAISVAPTEVLAAEYKKLMD